MQMQYSLVPRGLFPSGLAAPGSVRPTFPASAPLPLVCQTAAPTPCGSQVSEWHFLCPCNTVVWFQRDAGETGMDQLAPPSEICSVVVDTAPIAVYTDVHLEIWACLRFSAHQSTCAQLFGGGSCEATLSQVIPKFSFSVIMFMTYLGQSSGLCSQPALACRLGPGPAWVEGQGVNVAGRSTFSSVPF